MERLGSHLLSFLAAIPVFLMAGTAAEIRKGVIIGVAVVVITGTLGGLAGGYMLLKINDYRLQQVEKRQCDVESKVEKHGDRLSALERVVPAYEFRPDRVPANNRR